MAKPFSRPPTAQEAVLTELRAWIATGKLRPGEQILQDTLALELGVSRVPLREALKTLEAEAVRRAVPLITAEDVDRIEEAAADVRRAAVALDVPAMATTNRRFHFALIGAFAMPRLVRILHVLWDSTEVYRAVYFTDDANEERVLDEHDELVASVKAGDAERALDVLMRHRQNAIAALRPLLELSDVDWGSPQLVHDRDRLEALD